MSDPIITILHTIEEDPDLSPAARMLIHTAARIQALPTAAERLNALQAFTDSLQIVSETLTIP